MSCMICHTVQTQSVDTKTPKISGNWASLLLTDSHLLWHYRHSVQESSTAVTRIALKYLLATGRLG